MCLKGVRETKLGHVDTDSGLIVDMSSIYQRLGSCENIFLCIKPFLKL